MSEQPAERRLERIDLTGLNDTRGSGCSKTLTGWPNLATCGAPITWELRITEDDGSILRGPGHCEPHARAAMADQDPDETGTWHWMGT